MAIILILVTLWPSFGFAGEDNKKSEPLKNAVETLNETVDKLIDIKDESSTATKAKLEKRSRIDTFREILKLSFIEIEEVKIRLNNLKNETLKKEEIGIKEEFLYGLDKYEAHVNNVEKSLEDGLALEELKILAKDLKNWRVNEYQPTLERIFDFLFIFQSKSLIATAKNRLDKISEDLAKIKKSGLPITKLQKLFNKAAINIDEASILVNEAHKNFVSSSLKDLEMASDTEQILKESETPTTPTAKQAPANVNSIRINLQKALINIKTAYQTFFEMYSIAKSLII